MTKRFLCLLLAIASGLAAAAEPVKVKNPDTFTSVEIDDADSFDPAYSYDTFSWEVILNLYEPLFAFDGSSTSRMLPLIAQQVPSRANGLVSPDGRTYVIPIRKKIHFHDGSLMTPEDVRYSILRFMLMDRDGGPSSLLLEPLLGYSSTRDKDGHLNSNAFKDAAQAVQVHGNTVVLRMPTPFAPLLSILCQWAPILSKQWAIKNGDWDGTEATWRKFNNPSKQSSPFFEHADGTGPFMLERWDRKTHQVVMIRNDHYWRKPARLKRVIIHGVDEFATRKLMLEAGDADSLYAQPDVYSQVQHIPHVKVIDGLTNIETNPVAFFTFHINPAGNQNVGSGRFDGEGIPPDFFSDQDVRKGFAYAFNYSGYLKDVFRGKGSQATGCIPMGLLGYNPRQKTYSFDLGKAAEHFKKAWGGKAWEDGFTFTLVYNSGNTYRKTMCEIIKRNVESLNPKFHINIRGLEWPTFLDHMVASKLPIFVMGWVSDYPDPHSFAFPMMHSKGQFPNEQKYSNLEADKLIEAAVREINPERRRQLYAKVQAIEFEDAPHILAVNPVRFRVQRDWVKGYVFNPVFPDAPYSSYFYPMWKE